ncbi:MAG: hypothetical protein HYZ53_03805 [Planctomycetes bacterium]|nr:hypothetical protein [Planctomycetota bacterium]
MVDSAPEFRGFDDFREYALWYLHDVGMTVPEILGHELRIVHAAAPTAEIEFGDWAGRPKWRGPKDLPGGEWNSRDALAILANLGNIQGDTEFGSNELQVGLWDTAPSDYDRKVLLSVMNEEFRHGWQMAHFELEVLGSEEARVAARTLLERRAGAQGNERLLGAFNQKIFNWIGMYSFLEFMDRDGGSQLNLLQRSSVEALAQSMSFMLREEHRHLKAGEQGYERMLEGGRLPIDLLQKYVNLYAPLGYDLHGGERSTNALIYWRLGLKGFYPSSDDYLTGPASAVIDEHLFADLRLREHERAAYGYRFLDLDLDGAAQDINKELLNSITVTFYRRSLVKHFERFNRLILEHYPPGTPKLVLPSLRFHRAAPSIYAGERYDIHGSPIEGEREYEAYLEANLPGAADSERLSEVFARPDWIARTRQDVFARADMLKSGDRASWSTRFGDRRPTRYVTSLARTGGAHAAPSPPRPVATGAAPRAELPLWRFMHEAGAAGADE